MNEEIQNSKIENESSEKNKSQTFPIWAKAILILLAILIIIGIYMIFAKPKNPDVPVQSMVQEQAKVVQSENNQVPANGETAPKTESQPATDVANQDATSSVDVDYEVKKMDESINSVDDGDFNSGSFSDAEIGL